MTVQPGTALADVIAVHLKGFHTEACSAHIGDSIIFRGRSVVALVRSLPDGRREVLVFEGRNVVHHVYPPCRLWVESAEKGGAS